MDGHLPPLYQCDLCGRDILRIEKDVWLRIEGYTRITKKGKLNAGDVKMLKMIGGVACQTCVDLKDNPPDMSLTLF